MWAAALAAAWVLCLPLCCCAQSTDKERLLALKSSFTNGADKLPSWRESSDPCTNWTGIGCDIPGAPGVVTRL